MHYHLGLICAHCLDHFTTNAEAMHCHAHVCKPMSIGTSNNDDDREEEDYEDDDNGDKDNEFEFKGDLLP